MTPQQFTPQKFIAKWQRVTLSERSACQQHFLDLCDLLGEPKPAAADPDGTWYTFEKGVDTTEDKKGWADVWMRDHFGWEYKGRHRDLKAAYAQRLRYRVMSDWYRLKLSRLGRWGHGQRLQHYWHHSAMRAIQDCFPLYDWKPWLFAAAPDGYWKSRGNRRDYMEWLGERLGFRNLEDWYVVTSRDFDRNRGKGILNYYRGSPCRTVMDVFPSRSWCEWKFVQVPEGFWTVAKNRRRYLRWIGRQLGFRRPADWYRIRAEDLIFRHGNRLVQLYPSRFYDLMGEFLPQLDWDCAAPRRPLSVQQVLAWADAHYRKHGKWPTSTSGTVPGTVRTWLAIDKNLKDGKCGLPAAGSLARLLEKQRGVRWGRRLPDLCERQILAWADEYFAMIRLITGFSRFGVQVFSARFGVFFRVTLPHDNVALLRGELA